MIKNILIGFLVLFSGCSNMSVGFEEDSIFYTEPVILFADEKEGLTSEKKAVSVNKKMEKSEIDNKVDQNIKVVEPTIAPIITVKPDKIESRKVTSQAPIVIKEKDPENETTFSYDPYDGE